MRAHQAHRVGGVVLRMEGKEALAHAHLLWARARLRVRVKLRVRDRVRVRVAPGTAHR